MRHSLSPGERDRYLAELRKALVAPPPLRLTPEGIALFVAASRRPQPPDDLAAGQREQHAVLTRAGLIGPDGGVTEAARDAADALDTPRVLVQVKAVRGRAAATWTAWVGAARSFVVASPSPALGAGDDPYAPAGPFDLEGELNVEIVVPGWTSVCAMRWLGVTPRPEEGRDEVRVQAALLERRLAGERVPPPDDAAPRLRTIWGQPTLLWAASSSPGDAALLMLDAGAAGLWRVRTEGGTSVLSPCSSREVWRDMMRLVMGTNTGRA